MTPLDSTENEHDLVGAGLPGWTDTPTERAGQAPEEPKASANSAQQSLRHRFPVGTHVSVRPALGGRWLGTVIGWTEPGTGREMAVVHAKQGAGPGGLSGPFHVAPGFLHTQRSHKREREQ